MITRRIEYATIKSIHEERRIQLQRGQISLRQSESIAAKVSDSEDKLIQAERRLVGQQLNLLRFVSDDSGDNGLTNFIPRIMLSDKAPEKAISAYIDEALMNRADYQRAQEKIQRESIQLGLEKNQTLARLDVVASVGMNGLESSFTRSLDSLSKEGNEEASIGLVYTIPWRNVEARSRVTEFNRRKRQAKLEAQSVRHNLILDVRIARRNIEAMKKRLSVARETRAFYERELRREKERLAKGEISSPDLLEYYRNLADSVSREYQMLVELNKSKVELWASMGVLPKKMSVVFTSSSQGDSDLSFKNAYR